MFELDGRSFELLEVKYEVQQDLNKVYNSFILLGAKSKTDFTLHLDDVLNKISVAGVLEKAMGVTLDYKCYPLEAQDFPELYRDFKILTNNQGDLIIDYSLSKKLLDELVFDPRKLLEHARLLDKLASVIEKS